MSKKIPLTLNEFAIVDDDLFDYLSQWKWSCLKRKYTFNAVRGEGPRKNLKYIYMHRVILNAPDGMVVDHINGNGLDNRRSNLRVCTNAENVRNQRLSSRNTSGYKGVTKANKKWMATIGTNGKTIYLGVYETPEMAAKAYDNAAIELFGRFARTNFNNRI